MSDFLKSQAEKNQETAAKGPQDEPEAEELGGEDQESPSGVEEGDSGPTPEGPQVANEAAIEEEVGLKKIFNRFGRPFMREGVIICIPYKEGMDLENVSVSPEEAPKEGGMIARNPHNPNDMWYIGPEYFEENYVPMEEEDPDAPPSSGRSTEEDLKRENKALKVRVRNLNRQLQNLRPEIGRR